MAKKHFTTKGFIDPLSLIGLGFLVITMIVGTAVINNKGINLSPNKKAAVPGCVDNGGQCVSSTYNCSGGKDSTLPGCGSTTVCGFGTCTAPTPNPTPREISPCNTCSGSSCIKKSGSCDPGLNECDSGTDCESTTSTTTTDTCPSTSRCKDNKYQTCSSGNWTTKANCTDSGQTCVNDSRKCISSTPAPTSNTNTTNCAQLGQTPTDTKPCCANLVKDIGPYGTTCTNPGTECSGTQTKCQLEGTAYFQYSCADGRYQAATKIKCDLGCDGNICKVTSTSPTTKICTVKNCLGTSCQATTTTVNLNSACPTSNCATDSNCAANTLTCDGKPIGTKVCNNAGGYNYCSSDGKWYSQACNTGTNCTNGECITTTSITCAGSCSYGIPCSQANRKTASGSCSTGSYCCGEVADLTCNGKPNGTTICTNTNKSFNQCESGTWINHPCTGDHVCPTGGTKCELPINTNTQIGESSSIVCHIMESASGYGVEINGSGLITTCPKGTVCATNKGCITPGLKTLGQTCSDNTECQSVNCQEVLGTKKCYQNQVDIQAMKDAYASGIKNAIDTTMAVSGILMLGYGAYQGVTDIYNYANSYINNYVSNFKIDTVGLFADTETLELIKSGMFPNFTNTLSTNSINPFVTNIIASQMKGELPSSAAKTIAQKANQLMQNEGLDTLSAVTQATNKSVIYFTEKGTVPADMAKSLEQSICLPGQCRNITQLSTATVNNMGLEADFSTFKVQNSISGEITGHAVTPVLQPDGTFGIIDATNNIATQSVDDYIAKLNQLNWKPITNIIGQINDWTVYRLP